jgi:putative acetyltransferase
MSRPVSDLKPEALLSTCGQYTIRPIRPEDNQAIADITIAVLLSFGCSGPGYASSDPELHCMYETYRDTDGEYFVVEENETGRVLGGAGFSRLKGTTKEEAVCELQKLYFLPELRGKGLAKQILSICFERAARMGFRHMYLETIPAMTAAINLYEKFGFQRLSQRMGDTGHNACPVFMLRELPVLSAV